MGSLPIKQVDYGVNYACFTENGVHYLCACQKRSIENRLRLTDEYFCKFGYYDIMTGITYAAHDPELKRIVLGLPPSVDEALDYDGDVTSQLRFKQHVCHDCNNAPAAFYSAEHPRSRKFRNLPYRINECIAFGVYPANKLPPSNKKHFFILDDAKIIRKVYDCTFSGVILNGFHYRTIAINIAAFIRNKDRFSDDDQRKLLCIPDYFGKQVEYELPYGFLYDLRRYAKSDLNYMISDLMENGVESVRSNHFELPAKELHAVYDYELKDGKIVMDKLLEPFFRTDLDIYLKYAHDPDAVGFCFKIHASNRFYKALGNVPPERLADAVKFAPNVVKNAETLQRWAESPYFAMLARGMQIGDYSVITLLHSSEKSEDEVMQALFDIIEDKGLHNKVSPIISAFFGKDMRLSYYDVKRRYVDLLYKILTFIPPSDKTRNKSYAEIIHDDFTAAFTDEMICADEYDSARIRRIFYYSQALLQKLCDENIVLRSWKHL